MLVIWETNFCFYVLKDERVARIKFAKFSQAPSNIEGEIHALKLNQHLNSNNSVSEVKYLNYLMELVRVKSYDEEICNVLIDMWTEINIKKPEIETIVKLVYKMHDLITIIKSMYSNLANKYK